jgi:hypothetical protein
VSCPVIGPVRSRAQVAKDLADLCAEEFQVGGRPRNDERAVAPRVVSSVDSEIDVALEQHSGTAANPVDAARDLHRLGERRPVRN